MFSSMADLRLTQLASQAFDQLPQPMMTPAEAYEKLVKGEMEYNALPRTADQNTGRIAATGIVPYPPGIPLLMPGESMSPDAGGTSPALNYLNGLEEFDRRFPGFSHDTHGIMVENGEYRMMFLK